MTSKLTIALAQIDPTVGALDQNRELILNAQREAAALGADIIVYPELVVTGYPPEDFLLRPGFQAQAKASVAQICQEADANGPAMIISAPWPPSPDEIAFDKDGRFRNRVWNALLVIDGGEIIATVRKVELPNYGVFDEQRVFLPGDPPGPVLVRGARLGLMTCEDMWFPQVSECLQETGAEILIAPHGSPFSSTKADERLSQAVARVTETDLPFVFVNLVGGQDELAFDGGSFVLNANRRAAHRLPHWRADLRLTHWENTDDGWGCTPGEIVPEEDALTAAYHAMCMGLRDYVNKNRFPGIILGLSGGIDSALSAAVAVDALGADRVRPVMMPSEYTSQESLDDAADCAKRLGIALETVSIRAGVDAMTASLSEAFEGKTPDTTEENMQSRLRGLILMALSNKFGHMVLTTGNKSEMAVGYATLYGDMCGGYSVIKDLYKTEVYAISNWRNKNHDPVLMGPPGAVIPDNIITKAPTAELKPNQTDQDSLPPYDVLDEILKGLIEERLSAQELVAKGFDQDTVVRVEGLLYRAEYKRFQAPPGVKLSGRSFGRDWRYPLTSGYPHDKSHKF
ncbi:MAG: NAD+ synthase [Pseudomonadota bacterium]